MKADPEVPPRLPAPLLRPLLDRELLLAAVLRVVGRREFVAGRLDRIGLGGEHALLSTVEDGPVISGYLHEGGEKSFHECWKGCWLNGNLVGVFPPTLVVGRSSYRVSGCEKKGKARPGRRRLEKEGSGKVPELESFLARIGRNLRVTGPGPHPRGNHAPCPHPSPNSRAFATHLGIPDIVGGVRPGSGPGPSSLYIRHILVRAPVTGGGSI